MVRKYKLSVDNVRWLLAALACSHLPSILEALTCNQCSGINCQRTSFKQTVICTDELDECITIFKGQLLQAQGCYEQIDTELREKCNDNSNSNAVDNMECLRCSKDLCNNIGPSDFKCVQCDSNEDERCHTNPTVLPPIICSLSRSFNSYCFAIVTGNRTMRGCTQNLLDQSECLSNENCKICSPQEIQGCNRMLLDQYDDGTGGEGSGGGTGGEGSGGGTGGEGSGGGTGGEGSGGGTGGEGSGGGTGGEGSGGGTGGEGSGGGTGGEGSGGGTGGEGSGGGTGGEGSGDGSNNGTDTGNNSANYMHSNSYKFSTIALFILSSLLMKYC